MKIELEPYFKPDTDQGTASDKKTSESTTPIETLETKPNFIPDDDQNTGAGKEVPISLEILEAKPDFMPGDDLDTGSDKKVPETPTILETLETLEAKPDIITKTMQGDILKLQPTISLFWVPKIHFPKALEEFS